MFTLSDGYQIHYESHGSGEPIVLVHGWGADAHSNWHATGWVSALSAIRTVITLDVRGHGQSDKPHEEAPYSYAAMSADVLRVMDAFGADQCDFLGYSMGAFMGAWLLGHHPRRFGRMILGGIGNESEESAAMGEVIAQALRATDPAKAHPYGRSVRQFVEILPHNDLQALACSAARMWPEGWPAEVAGPGASQATLPILIVNGEDDEPYVSSAHSFAETLPDARVEILPGCDHLSAVSNSRFKDVVLEFLSAPC